MQIETLIWTQGHRNKTDNIYKNMWKWWDNAENYINSVCSRWLKQAEMKESQNSEQKALWSLGIGGYHKSN